MDEVIRLFNKNAIRYLLIGGQAMRLEGMPRFSMDWDFYLPARDQGNLDRINDLLGDHLDLPLLPLGDRGENFVQTYQLPWGVIQFHLGGAGLPPFDDAEKRMVSRKTENGAPVRCLCGNDLLAAKKAANRPQDQQDIEFLEKKRALGKFNIIDN